jgi:hypothetical protein
MKQKPRAQTKTQAKKWELQMLLDTPPDEWPTDSPQMFRAVLANPAASHADKLIAAELAGEYIAIDDESANVLMGILGSATEPEDLRARAAISLGPALEGCDIGEFDDPHAPPPISEEVFEKIKRLLHLLYHEDSVPKLVQRRILEASVRAEEKWHAQAVRRAYNSKDAEWVLTAVFCMKYVNGFEKEIEEALRSTDPEVHLQAVEAAGAQEVDEAWEHVYSLLENADTTPKSLLIAAIGAVANIRQDTPSLEILNHLVDSEDIDVSDAADDALAMAGAYTPFDEDDLDAHGDASGWIN